METKKDDLDIIINTILTDEEVSRVSVLESAGETLNLITTKRERVKVILSNKTEFLFVNGSDILRQDFIDEFAMNCSIFLEEIKTVLSKHQKGTMEAIDKEIMLGRMFDFCTDKSKSFFHSVNRLFSESAYRHKIEISSLGFAVIQRILDEIDDIISYYKEHVATQDVKGVPELVTLLQDLRYVFFNLLRSQMNFNNSICGTGKTVMGLSFSHYLLRI